MIFLKIQFFNKISVPYWEPRWLRKHIFPKGSLLRAMHSLPRTPDPISCEPKLCKRSLQTQSSLCSNPRYCWHSCWKEAHWACFILCLQSRTSLSSAKSQVCHGQLWLLLCLGRDDEKHLFFGCFGFGVFFFPACSYQLIYTNILGAAGRHLAKSSDCIYYKVHLGTPCSQKHRLQSFSTPEVAGKAVHSCPLQFLSMSPERRTIPAAPHPDPGGTLASHPGQPSSHNCHESWCEVSTLEKQTKEG